MKVDEEGMAFRPSNNFKYMKKYCKGKVEASSDMRSEEVPEPQPPLPPGPPPPEAPPELLTPKRELDEEDLAHAATDEERIMCREYVRGKCTRGSICIYAHEIIPSQLPGIYTFCRDFQNTTCTFLNCKFVHATVFEKEFFYRTGFLPPHTTSHLKEALATTAAAAAAPSPPTHAHPKGQANAPATFPSATPASLMNPGGVGGAGCVSGADPRPAAQALAAGSAAGSATVIAAASAFTAAPALRILDDPGASTAGGELVVQRRCANCDIIKLRRCCQINKLKKLKLSIQELDQRTAALDCKTSKLETMLLAICEQKFQNKVEPNRAININISNGQQQGFMEAPNPVFTPQGMLASRIEDDPTKMLPMLTRLLMEQMESPPSDK